MIARSDESRVTDWSGDLSAPMKAAIEQSRTQLGAAIDSVDPVKRARHTSTRKRPPGGTLIALGEEPPLAYPIHHARSLVHHCLSVDSRCLRKEGGCISRTAWPSWASWPCRPPRWYGHCCRRGSTSA